MPFASEINLHFGSLFRHPYSPHQVDKRKDVPRGICRDVIWIGREKSMFSLLVKEIGATIRLLAFALISESVDCLRCVMQLCAVVGTTGQSDWTDPVSHMAM
jgi:hypothetical protein